MNFWSALCQDDQDCTKPLQKEIAPEGPFMFMFLHVDGVDSNNNGV